MSSHIELGLERIGTLLSHLPTYTRPTCHIAGTNGKGSVSALISSILSASSYRVGRFNSPHLVSVLDSITIDDVPVSRVKYSEIRSLVEAANESHRIGASSFEVLTATALLTFEDAKVDIAVVEVGMGGRLDATNIIPDECIMVSALTAVDLDHQAFLGNTVSEIAFEKASIARKNRPFVLGPQIHPEVAGVVQEVVSKVGGILLQAAVPSPREWDAAIDDAPQSLSALSTSDFQGTPRPVWSSVPYFSSPLPLVLPLHGDHQLENLATALAVVSALLTHGDLAFHPILTPRERITADTIATGVRNTRWPGRLSFHNVSLPLQTPPTRTPPSIKICDYLVLADGAHNPASSATLGTFVTNLLQRVSQAAPTATSPRTFNLSFILGLSHSPPKTPLQTLTPLFSPLAELSLPSNVQIYLRVALLEFSAVEGMPWVRPEVPVELKSVVTGLLPGADIWTPEGVKGKQVGDDLRAALNWAAGGQRAKDDEVEEGLIVVAGSLYLVADFYRLLQSVQSNADIQ